MGIQRGERWRHKNEISTWRVTTVDKNSVNLSGPGPCRAYKTVDLKEFCENWVKEEVTNI